MQRFLVWFLALSLFSIGAIAQPSEPLEPLQIQVQSVVMGTDGQMRVRINGQYLTRHSEKDGIKVLDMDYETVKVEARGQVFWLKPHQTLKLEDQPQP